MPGAYMHLHRHKLCSAHKLCTRAEPCDWSAGAHGVTTMLGLSLQARWDTILASTASTGPPSEIIRTSSTLNHIFKSFLSAYLPLRPYSLESNCQRVTQCALL